MKIENLWDSSNDVKRAEVSSLGEISESSLEQMEREERGRCDYVASTLKDGKSGEEIYNKHAKKDIDIFKKEFEEGDSVIHYNTLRPEILCGSKGYALVRRGRVVKRYAYVMS